MKLLKAVIFRVTMDLVFGRGWACSVRFGAPTPFVPQGKIIGSGTDAPVRKSPTDVHPVARLPPRPQIPDTRPLTPVTADRCEDMQAGISPDTPQHSMGY